MFIIAAKLFDSIKIAYKFILFEKSHMEGKSVHEFDTN